MAEVTYGDTPAAPAAGPSPGLAANSVYPLGQDVQGFNSNLRRSFLPRKAWVGGRADPMVTGFFHMFMTKPTLNLSEDNTLALNLTQLPEWENLSRMLSLGGPGGSFIPILSNLAMTNPLSDVTAEPTNAFENFHGHGIVLGGRTIQSRVMDRFSIQYTELTGATVLNLHKIWVKYIEYASEGFVTRSEHSFESRVLDYAASTYVFLTEPDNRTLTFWAKYTGVFPVGVPWSSLGGQRGEVSSVTPEVPYAYSYYEENEPDIIRDFNSVATGAYSGFSWDSLTSGERRSEPVNVPENYSEAQYGTDGTPVARPENAPPEQVVTQDPQAPLKTAAAGPGGGFSVETPYEPKRNVQVATRSRESGGYSYVLAYY